MQSPNTNNGHSQNQNVANITIGMSNNNSNNATSTTNNDRRNSRNNQNSQCVINK